MTPRLSPRMVKVVELVAGQGYTYQEVADELGVHVSTIKKYVALIGDRMGKAPRRAIATYYREHLAGGKTAA